jgi:putative acetyltransferase
VATCDQRIAGHVVCTRGWVGELAALGLGPISVVPDHQRHGIGQALMHAVIGAADAVGEPLIALLGDQRFYGRFGFVEASRMGILAPDPAWGAHFQARMLTDCPSSIASTFRYAAPFDDLKRKTAAPDSVEPDGRKHEGAVTPAEVDAGRCISA